MTASLEYSSDSGSTWYPISDVTFSVGYGSFTWYAPETASNQYLIRITSASISDTSDGLWSVLEPSPFRIGGNIISSSGLPLNNVTISFDNGGGIYYSDLLGDYSSDIFTSSFTGTATPSLSGYTFTPVNRSYVSNNIELVSENYVGVLSTGASTFIVSGAVFVSGTSNPIPYVTMSFTGFTKTTPFYTNINGQYSRSVSSGHTGTLTPSHPYYSFQPTSKLYLAILSDVNDSIFSGSLVLYTISGSVASSSGDFLSAIDIHVSNPSLVVTTDGSGQYNQSVTKSISTTFTPSSSNYAFDPGFRYYQTASGNFNNQDYSASGLIAPTDGLGSYYYSKVSYITASSTWVELSGKGQDIVVQNPHPVPQGENENLNLGFGLQNQTEASFYGTQVSPSFAIEMFFARSTINPFEKQTLLSTIDNTYPYISVYVTQSHVEFGYKYSADDPAPITVKSHAINITKFNHIVFYVSGSKMGLWSNGKFLQSASVTHSVWNGGTMGINSNLHITHNEFPFVGLLNLVKIWNSPVISVENINRYYVNRSFWNDFPTQSMSWIPY